MGLKLLGVMASVTGYTDKQYYRNFLNYFRSLVVFIRLTITLLKNKQKTINQIRKNKGEQLRAFVRG